LVTHGGVTTGVLADPAEYPFQPLPNFANSRFGVALRNARGLAQPMLFAPLLGGAGSQMKAGETREFVMRLVVAKANLSATYERVARTLYGFADVRHNALGSLNATFERMLEFAAGHTHHHVADGRQEILAACCTAVGVPLLVVQTVLQAETVEAGLGLLRQHDEAIAQQVYQGIVERIDQRAAAYVHAHTGQALTIGSMVFDRQRQKGQQRRGDRHADHVAEVGAGGDRDVLERVGEGASPFEDAFVQHAEIGLREHHVGALACDLNRPLYRDAHVGRM
jgi:hypothetical protein